MVSIIVPTLTGGLGMLQGLVQSLQTEKDIELIVIDNNSRDGTIPFMSNYECILKVNKNLNSFAKSNNMGAKMASGDYLLFVNNDIRIMPGLVEQMRSVFDLDEKIGIVGCLLKLMDYPSKIQHAGVMFTEDYVPYELGLPLSFGVPEVNPQDERITAVREVPSVTAACMMIKKNLFNELGGFNENYMNGWEDTDLVLRARELGYKAYYTGKTYALHKHFGSRDRGRFTHEAANRKLYDDTWIITGRAKNVLKDFIYG